MSAPSFLTCAIVFFTDNTGSAKTKFLTIFVFPCIFVFCVVNPIKATLTPFIFFIIYGLNSL